MFKIDKRSGRPYALHQFFTAHDFARVIQERDQNVQWLLLNSQPHAVLAEIPPIAIDLV
jgi:hypothetical protein